MKTQFLLLLMSCEASLDASLELQDASDSASVDPTGEALACELDSSGSLHQAPEAAFIAQEGGESGERMRCTSVVHATAGARGSVLEVSLSEWDGMGSALLSVRDLGEGLLVEPVSLQQGEAVQVTLPQSGEVLIHLEPVDSDAPSNAYGIEVGCVTGCDLAFTRYPVMLMHGLGGAESFGDVDYFYRVREVLEPQGYALYSPAVLPFSTTEARALEWETHLDALVDEGIGRRFNLIGHSQGGLDARYLVGGLGRSDRVSSIVTIGTPHHGTPVADFLAGTVEDGPVDEFWVDLGTDAFALFFGLEGEDHSLVDAMGALSVENLADFNEQVPDHDQVYYASWSGMSCGALDFDCQDTCRGEVVDPLLATLHLILELYGEPNDGMVPSASAVWGDFQGEICADHADQVGLFADQASDAFDHLAFYQDELERLADRGL